MRLAYFWYLGWCHWVIFGLGLNSNFVMQIWQPCAFLGQQTFLLMNDTYGLIYGSAEQFLDNYFPHLFG